MLRERCVAVCCELLRVVAVCCGVLRCVTLNYSVLQCVAVCCSVLQSVATSYGVWQCVAAGKVCRLCSKRREIIIMMTWLIHMWTATHSCAGRDSFTCVTWLNHMCDLTQSYHSSALRSGKHAGMWRDSCTCVPWLIHMCNDISQCVTWLTYICDVTPPHLWICAPLNMCHDLSLSMCHDPSLNMCHDSSLNMFHDSRMHLWICDVTQPHQSLAGCVLKSESPVRPPSVSQYINEPRHTFRCVMHESWHIFTDESRHMFRMYAYIHFRWGRMRDF